MAQRGFAVSIPTPTGNKTQGEIISRYFVWRIPISANTTTKPAPYAMNRSTGRGSHLATSATQSTIATPTGMLSHQTHGATDSLTKSENTLNAALAKIDTA